MDRKTREFIRDHLQGLTYKTSLFTSSILHAFLPDRQFINRVLRGHLQAYEKTYDLFVSALYWPVRATDVVSIEEPTTANRETAIIMQGPLVSGRDFTLETVKIYEKIYPGTKVIVSTWKTEDPDYIKRIKNETSCEVILNDYPEFPGACHLNYQIFSTMAGLRRAKELGFKYAMKTRCDQRFYKFQMFELFTGLMDAFPVFASVPYQKKRIVSGAGEYSPFIWGGITDQFNHLQQEVPHFRSGG